MKLYYVEQKGYCKDSTGYDRQFADGGQIPMLYLSKEKAIKRAQHMIDIWTESHGLQITIDNEHYPSRGTDVLFATRLEGPLAGMRYEIRVYEIETLV